MAIASDGVVEPLRARPTQLEYALSVDGEAGFRAHQAGEKGVGQPRSDLIDTTRTSDDALLSWNERVKLTDPRPARFTTFFTTAVGGLTPYQWQAPGGHRRPA